MFNSDSALVARQREFFLAGSTRLVAKSHVLFLERWR